MPQRKRIKLAVMIGSESDLPQCESGLRLIEKAVSQGQVDFIGLYVCSIHRNTEEVLKNLYDLIELFDVNRLIVGAGMANHLTGTVDAYVRYGLGVRVPVFGAIFEVAKDSDVNRQAAILSITQVPGTQVIFSPEDPTFFHACELALAEDCHEPQFGSAKPVKIFFGLDDVFSRIKKLETT